MNIRHFFKPRYRLSCYGLLGLLSSVLVMACAPLAQTETLTVPAPADTSQTLTILWDKGYVIEEDEAIEAAVQQWQTETGESINLSFYNSGEIAPKTLRASKAGTPPDILFAAKSVYPIDEWADKLADVTDIIEPVADQFTPSALQAAHIYGAENAQGRYYAVPLNQSVIQIHYWKDLLAQAGYTPDDIPQDWERFWAFWKTAQDNLRGQGMEDIYALGLPYSLPAKDSYHLFEQALVAHDVKLLDEQGNLLADQPGVRDGIIKVLGWYSRFYRDGYVPPGATKWLDPDNNRNLLNRNVLMTPNPTLSIPAAVRNDPDTYRDKLGTLPWPNQLDGTPMSHLMETRLAVIFSDSPNQAAAKQFLSYLIRPEVTNEFLKTSYGRFMPPSDGLRSDPFWQNPDDPHVSVATRIVVDGQTQPYGNALNPAYGVALEQNIWGEVLHDIVENNITPEVAADKAITRLKEIFDQWS
ncbi:MAG: ABC transporter substrate-binding protein [Cyanobacteria bacterium P01_G01_bin.38]